MATTMPATTPDTLISLKVSYDGTTRRFKLPLRELSAVKLESQLRSQLELPMGQLTIERYSDSAASYVVLDTANLGVYKQLYRAAKAKQKLKLRVTLEEQERTTPKPATVEDDSEAEVKVEHIENATLRDKADQGPDKKDGSVAEAHVPTTLMEPMTAPSTNNVDAPTAASSAPSVLTTGDEWVRDQSTATDTASTTSTTSVLPTGIALTSSTVPALRFGMAPEVGHDISCLSQALPTPVQDSAIETKSTEMNSTTAQLDKMVNEMAQKRRRERLEKLNAELAKTGCKPLEFDDADFAQNKPEPIPVKSVKPAKPANAGMTAPGMSCPGMLPYSGPFLPTTVPTIAPTTATATASMEVPASASASSSSSASSVCPARKSRITFAVYCNHCERAIPDAHFHCSTCDEGDFDLCEACREVGITCHDSRHWLIKRTIKDGQINSSETHVVATKPMTSAVKTTAAANAPAVVQPSKCTRSMNHAAARNHMPMHTDVEEIVKEMVGFHVSSSLGGPSRARVDGSAGTESGFRRFVRSQKLRTCNCCVRELAEKEFLHCTSCEDFDLCKNCFADGKHGHHPKHGFTPAVKGTLMESSISSRLAPGRNVLHNAICDGCDKIIYGIRHKCLDCPDWDYCADCQVNADFIHPNHRFAAIYEPLPEPTTGRRLFHDSIRCDGPLCNSVTSSSGASRCISGIRYKCAVCHDTDFCAACEASPANTHNPTHPLIKFKTPVRHVSVTTTGEHEDGQQMRLMGDRLLSQRRSNRSTETVLSPAPGPAPSSEHIALNSVQTVVDMKPSVLPMPVSNTEEERIVRASLLPTSKPTWTPSMVESKVETGDESKEPVPDLLATFERDSVPDGTIMPPNHTFEQTWVMKNTGRVAWPAGCCVRFVGGDYMGAVDPTHPAGIRELVSASESTICYSQLQPGQEFPFTVLMRTPDRKGKVISYWRLTTSDGHKFGHKLWCDVTVSPPAPKPAPKVPAPVVKEENSILDSEVPTMTKSQMIIPKLEHESSSSSIMESAQTGKKAPTSESDTLAPSVHDDEFEDCAEAESWADDSDDGFLTDEEYDILDASDEDMVALPTSSKK